MTTTAVKPPIIAEIEQYYQLELRPSSAPTLEEFMRYRRKKENKNYYLLDGDQLIGLNLRTNDLTNFPFSKNAALHSLKALKLCENKLPSIEIPTEMQQLEYLDLSDNETLTEVVFKGAQLPNLKVLDLSDSKVEALDLPNCPVLEKLDGSRNAP